MPDRLDIEYRNKKSGGMDKPELIQEVARQMDMDCKTVSKFLNTLLNVIMDEVACGERGVSIGGFGAFHKISRPGRLKKVVSDPVFTPYRTFKNRLLIEKMNKPV